ncbi:hypothetical protein B0H63DRAFT_496816 [Podospora didyma]|uniref:Uncharacterized protein n=1 Tax=Podospora didyma TaxID=330526 RepID=A0AAE0N6M1_9PEZI|nr:hypothetical protein B0H63DRAFT_496816 [Podospora didyma]
MGEFIESNTPKYAILSHIWGDNKLTFSDLEHLPALLANGKIDGCCAKAIAAELDYSSSAELSETINSMDLLGKKIPYINEPRLDFLQLLSDVANMPKIYLVGTGNIGHVNIAQRMSWASARCTSRKEDLASSLLDLFDVNMPLLYGEGDKAFLRLQEEIMSISSDESLFRWGLTKRRDIVIRGHPNVPAYQTGHHSLTKEGH